MMKTKKYEARTEQEAIKQVKDELGKDAIILSIKKIKPKGLFKFIRKPNVEVNVAYDDSPPQSPLPIISKPEIKESNSEGDIQKVEQPPKEIIKEVIKEVPIDNSENIEKLNQKIDNLEVVLKNMSESFSKRTDGIYKNKIIQVMYDNLILNEVLPEIANNILLGLDEFISQAESNSESALKIAYDRIVQIIGTPQPIVIDHKPKIAVIMGSTGVGKTTTIAKLSSLFLLNEKYKVGLITADTYRIAAVEQLKTYADILGIDTEVIYSADEIDEILDRLSNNDIIFVDTAGRSHKNKEQFEELSLLLSKLSNADKYLVLSLVTKLVDLRSMLELYSDITDFNVIFTKLDETLAKGNILNICYLTKKPVSYITNGQNVPDDIKVVNPQEIAKTLLGSNDE